MAKTEGQVDGKAKGLSRPCVHQEVQMNTKQPTDLV